MEIIDRPLSEIIKEQKIGESLRKNRRGGSGRGGQQNARGGQQNARGGRGGGAARGGAPSGRGRAARRGRGAGSEQQQERRRRLRPRGNGGPLRRLGFREEFNNNGVSRRFRRRYAMDMGDDRRDRSVKSLGAQLRGRTTFDRNDRVRASRRREELLRRRGEMSRSRSRFSRD